MAETRSEADLEAEVDAILAEFNGDVRAAIKALLHDLSILAKDAESVSRGLVRRGKVIVLWDRRAGRG